MRLKQKNPKCSNRKKSNKFQIRACEFDNACNFGRRATGTSVSPDAHLRPTDSRPKATHQTKATQLRARALTSPPLNKIIGPEKHWSEVTVLMIGKCTQGGRAVEEGLISGFAHTPHTWPVLVRTASLSVTACRARFFTRGSGVRHPDPLVDGRLQRCPVRELAAARRSRKPSSN